MGENNDGKRTRPTIALPARSTVENLFTGGAGLSPGPMTLVSSFFSENDPDSEYRSFSQLLAGAMGSPVAAVIGNKRQQQQQFSFESSENLKEEEFKDGNKNDFRFVKQNKPLSNLVVGGTGQSNNNMFTIPPGLSPTSLLDSPTFFTPGQGPFGMSHQQALAQVTAQAAQSQSPFHMPNGYPSSILAPPATSVGLQPAYATSSVQMPDPNSKIVESSIVSYSDQRSQLPPLVVDKPADDGYNWRKYGQKQVKGSEFPRSYYKCTHPNCPVKKKVERSLDGHVTEIIYKGQHSHQPPQHVKRAKDGGHSNGKPSLPGNPEMGIQNGGNMGRLGETAPSVSKSRRDQESSQATHEQLSGSSDGEEVGDGETRVEEEDQDQPEPKRRITEVRVSEPASSHRAVTEPRIIVQTTSEVDLLDDGYRWRKYGQKVVKGNPHPRSYYKCTNSGCNVRKHVERAATDPKAVITTYEGKHNHDVPQGKSSSHSNMPQIKPHNAVAEKHALVKKIGGSDQQPVSLLRFKEEQVT
ncbi:hypothetical protein IFM89_003119 [Coptis chinensis]|uniref:WRKY domain-containing protein n=1 Tax=Coptis chinensis TaxID=261450 RepID=A0A835IXS4_9MAGN|nr:hypothetical protein IFM89_003119 [Coptis chinensis]